MVVRAENDVIQRSNCYIDHQEVLNSYGLNLSASVKHLKTEARNVDNASYTWLQSSNLPALIKRVVVAIAGYECWNSECG